MDSCLTPSPPPALRATWGGRGPGSSRVPTSLCPCPTGRTPDHGQSAKAREPVPGGGTPTQAEPRSGGRATPPASCSWGRFPRAALSGSSRGHERPVWTKGEERWPLPARQRGDRWRTRVPLTQPPEPSWAAPKLPGKPRRWDHYDQSLLGENEAQGRGLSRSQRGRWWPESQVRLPRWGSLLDTNRELFAGRWFCHQAGRGPRPQPNAHRLKRNVGRRGEREGCSQGAALCPRPHRQGAADGPGVSLPLPAAPGRCQLSGLSPATTDSPSRCSCPHITWAWTSPPRPGHLRKPSSLGTTHHLLHRPEKGATPDPSPPRHPPPPRSPPDVHLASPLQGSGVLLGKSWAGSRVQGSHSHTSACRGIWGLHFPGRVGLEGRAGSPQACQSTSFPPSAGPLGHRPWQRGLWPPPVLAQALRQRLPKATRHLSFRFPECFPRDTPLTPVLRAQDKPNETKGGVGAPWARQRQGGGWGGARVNRRAARAPGRAGGVAADPSLQT